ncbi:MAG TPA: hypothetical protein VIG99_11400, partial [Myxococcaceae bacterium]
LDLTDLEAFSDGEGAVSVALASAQGILVWGELDARTGLFRMLSQATGSGLLSFQTLSAPMPGLLWDDGTSKRAGGVVMSRAVANTVVQSLIYEDVYSDAGRGTFASVNPGGLAYLPNPGTCLPPGPVTLESDPAGGSILYRVGTLAPVPLQLPAPPSRTLSSEWVSVDGGTVFRSPAGCLTAPTQLVASGTAAGARLSVAGTANDDRAYAYDTPTGRALTCLRSCGSGACTNVGSESTGASSELSIASANAGSFVLRAERSAGEVILSRHDLAQGCGNGPTPVQELGRLTTGSSIRKFRPVMFGRRPGLLYLSTAGGPGVLRTFIP